MNLRKAGISVTLDDFGTGYSSLSYLRKFHIDYLKIDQSFVHDLEHDANDVALCEAIIAMAHKLGIKVIAEGVETGAQRDFLTQAGCNYAQGYLCSKPVPVDEFEKLLGKWAETVRPSNSAPI
jgi:EAL domain-containing protein (putative c-di-GMP-specific phosphodiesterase class I)